MECATTSSIAAMAFRQWDAGIPLKKPWSFLMKFNYNRSFKLIWWISSICLTFAFDTYDWKAFRCSIFRELSSLQEFLQAWVTHTMCKRASHIWASWRDAKMWNMKGFRWLRRRLLLCLRQLTKGWGCITFLMDGAVGAITKCAPIDRLAAHKIEWKIPQEKNGQSYCRPIFGSNNLSIKQPMGSVQVQGNPEKEDY